MAGSAGGVITTVGGGGSSGGTVALINCTLARNQDGNGTVWMISGSTIISENNIFALNSTNSQGALRTLAGVTGNVDNTFFWSNGVNWPNGAGLADTTNFCSAQDPFVNAGRMISH